ncbi:hypothetical protein [Microbispora sp. CA-102843]|uniref:hypothetical protein n=1 Tax=Microbispora sp. CA-102843 TaxID=3239952 RepID=UPI003D9436B7
MSADSLRWWLNPGYPQDHPSKHNPLHAARERYVYRYAHLADVYAGTAVVA